MADDQPDQRTTLVELIGLLTDALAEHDRGENIYGMLTEVQAGLAVLRSRWPRDPLPGV